MNLYNISQSHTSVYKAIGITLIVLHNYLHWTNNIGENEMQLDTQRLFSFINFIAENPTKFLDAIFSYLGHYGVQIFIFISGYAFTKQFMAKNFNLSFLSYKTYIIKRLIKIYFLMLLAICACFIFYIKNPLEYLESVFMMLIGVKNFKYSTLFQGVGPWWYFILAVQLYFVFPFLYCIIDKHGKKGFYILILICYLLIYSLFPITEKFSIPMFGNFLGHLPEFLLGIVFARIKDMRLDIKIVLVALVVFVLSNRYELFFPLSFLSITIIFIYLIDKLIPKISQPITNLFVFIGSISMFMFVINGPIRAVIVHQIQVPYNLNPLLFSFINLAVVVFASYLLSIVFNKLKEVSNKANIPI